MPKARAKRNVSGNKDVSFELVSLPIGKVKLWKDNPRKNDKAVDRLAALIKENGVRSPIVVWKKDMTVYKGNTTLKALKKLGYEFVPVVLAEFESKAKAIAYALSDNKASEWAEWDEKVLTKLLAGKELATLKNIPKATGFKDADIQELKHFKSINGYGDFDKTDRLKEDTVTIPCSFLKEDYEKFQKDIKNIKVHYPGGGAPSFRFGFQVLKLLKAWRKKK